MPRNTCQRGQEGVTDMTNRLLIAAFCAAMTVSAGADAGEVCASADKDTWLSVDEVHAKLAELGYSDYHLGIEDGCYEAKLVAQNGDKVEVYMDPVTGDVVKTKIE